MIFGVQLGVKGSESFYALFRRWRAQPRLSTKPVTPLTCPALECPAALKFAPALAASAAEVEQGFALHLWWLCDCDATAGSLLAAVELVLFRYLS